MNELIKELVEQALQPPHKPNNGYIFPVEKFAELIIRECASIDFYNLPGFGLYHDDLASQAIKEHFGVKE